MSVLSEINQLVKIAQNAPKKSPQDAQTAQVTEQSPQTPKKVMDAEDFNSELKKRLAVMSDSNGWYKTQKRKKAWNKDQQEQMNSWARYIKAVRKSKSATYEQQQKALHLSDMLVKTYGTKPNYDGIMPDLKAKYGKGVSINEHTGGLEVKGKPDVAMPLFNPEVPTEIKNYWALNSPDNIKKLLVSGDSMSQEHYDQVEQDLQSNLTRGSNGEYAVSNRNWVDLAPGISIRPRMVRGRNGNMVVDPADQRVMKRYRRYKSDGSTAADRLPTEVRINGKSYVRVNGRLISFDRYVESLYPRSKTIYR